MAAIWREVRHKRGPGGKFRSVGTPRRLKNVVRTKKASSSRFRFGAGTKKVVHRISKTKKKKTTKKQSEWTTVKR